MTTKEILNGVFQQVFEDDAIQINDNTTADDIDGWDSLSHVNLILAVETTFKIRFSQKELLTFKNVGDLLRSVEAKIG
ncbi:MAG TPA: acyl carrier protein [Geobacteraceae bacterium]|nr:acyl carrier protein [Geobacteraceae bacterium]